MKEVFDLIKSERKRQRDHVELIASENFASKAVLRATGSILTNKYAEGVPGRRYYGGCQVVDQIESLTIESAKRLFGADHANVQPHSGSQANMAVYMTLLKPGDRVLALDLSSGGHLSHGHRLSFSGQLYDFHFYRADPVTGLIDYDQVRELAHQLRPRLIVTGASSYYRLLDFPAFRQIADEVGSYLMVDMAHIAGLVAAGVHPSPVPYAHFVTSTTHKTLRGPRGGLILCQQSFAKDLDKVVFPGVQGGPLMHVIAGKAVCFLEALEPDFVSYQMQVVANAKAMAEAFNQRGARVISGGTDTHMFIIETLSRFNLTGLQVQDLLDEILVTCNKNSIPGDVLSPMTTSGVRIGTPAMTTRGFKEAEFVAIANIICDYLDRKLSARQAKRQVAAIVRRFPLK